MTANSSREDVLCLMDEVVSLRRQEPEKIQNMYIDSTLMALKEVKFDKGPKLVHNKIKSVDLPDTLPDVNLIVQELEEIESTLIENVTTLRILCEKKKFNISKIMTNSSPSS